MEVSLHQVFDTVARKVGPHKLFGRANLRVKLIKAINSNEFLAADDTGSIKIQTWKQGWRGYEHYQCQNKNNLIEESYVQIRNIKVDLHNQMLYLDAFTSIYIVKPFPIG